MTTTTLPAQDNGRTARSYNNVMNHLEFMADGDTKQFQFPAFTICGYDIEQSTIMVATRVALDQYKVNCIDTATHTASTVKRMTRNEAAWHIRNMLHGSQCDETCPCTHGNA